MIREAKRQGASCMIHEAKMRMVKASIDAIAVREAKLFVRPMRSHCLHYVPVSNLAHLFQISLPASRAVLLHDRYEPTRTDGRF